jgi:hypothetical protein
MSQINSDTLAANPSNRPMAEAMGVEDTTDSEAIIQQGGRAVEAMGDDLEAASTGHLKEVDMDQARQRLRDCQAALAGLGYAVGDGHDSAHGIDGVSSRTLKDAVLQFQDDNDLDTHGRIDRDTYENILRAFEQGMSMQAHGEVDDDFSFVQGNHAIGSGQAEASDTTGIEDAEVLDDGDQALIDLQDDIDAGEIPSELEDL